MQGREIRFRGIDIETGEWVYGHYHEGSHAHYISTFEGRIISIDLKTLGQYVGLKDKNNQPIYEGDVDSYGYIIGWHRERACFGQFDANGRVMSYPLSDGYLTIIGNIHANPELIHTSPLTKK